MQQPDNIDSKKDLKNCFENELIKYNISPKIFYAYLNQFFAKTSYFENSFIDIFSPYFYLLLYNYPDVFSLLFIPIVIEVIEKKDLKNDFINAFNKIKQSNIEEISIFFNFNKTNDIYRLFKKNCYRFLN